MNTFRERQTRCGVSMEDCRLVGGGLAFGRDVRNATWHGQPHARLFVASEPERCFRGYVTDWSTRKRGACFRLSVWGHGGKFERVYKTKRGAERAMVQRGLLLAGEGG
jgi:hypothetical protein